MMTDQRSVSDTHRLRHPVCCDIFRATLGYIAIVYAVWLCYYALTDLPAGAFRPAPVIFIFSLFATLGALSLVGVPTILGTVFVLLLRPRIRLLWLTVMSVLMVFAPSLYWWVQPNIDHESMLIQLIAQALYLAYLLITLRPAQNHGGWASGRRACW
ncbi:hypothetical protein [Micromonospora zhanjiangensis]